MLLLGALALAVPAVTLASGGGSAGDQQYTDPFAGTPQSKTTTTRSAPPTSTAPATSAPTPTSASPTSTSPTTTPVASTQTSSDPTTPTATIATSTAGQLPRTGYDSWLAGALGFVLVGGGLALRVRLRQS